MTRRSTKAGYEVSEPLPDDGAAPGPTFAGAGENGRLIAENARLRTELSMLGDRASRLAKELQSYRAENADLRGRRQYLNGMRAQMRQELERQGKQVDALLDRIMDAGLVPTSDRQIRGLGQRLRHLLASLTGSRGSRASPTQPTRPRQETNRGPQHLVSRKRGARPAIGIVVLGLSDGELERVLDTVDAVSTKRNVTPVLLTDADNFAAFRARSLLFEYHPPAAVRAQLPELDWELYLRRRIRMFMEKWRPVDVIPFGETSREAVSQWRQDADGAPQAR